MKKVFKMELFEKDFLQQTIVYKQLAKQDLDNAKTTWANELVGLTKEEMTEEQRSLVKDEWFGYVKE